jgi:hypothetical protein
MGKGARSWDILVQPGNKVFFIGRKMWVMLVYTAGISRYILQSCQGRRTRTVLTKNNEAG